MRLRCRVDRDAFRAFERLFRFRDRHRQNAVLERRADGIVVDLAVQGDLPFLQPETITRAVAPLRRNNVIPMGTVRTPICDEEEWRNPNIVKVVTDAKGFALYFSRAAIPFARNPSTQTHATIAARIDPATRMIEHVTAAPTAEEQASPLYLTIRCEMNSEKPLAINRIEIPASLGERVINEIKLAAVFSNTLRAA